ncbi:hypothetical protein [Lonepinella koalarum]|uniref:Uncharacterized protein n=2 Tax=Lonepinella koalarum TaxID=53417 RepID=A0A4R1KXM2_9PAST|nr:hypothetical protein [Lonepinella koalarum]MDH2925576.1 hypothetical protein [Lonepinella koalarum]MDH2927272.1 hypothetical protein [Lonepinella koalarum]MDH2927296.1 hypothetical protein [Lonepinella koalarum]MDH2927938.1 hypothetical protein [Lonepinella koalarum]TCK70138.1 hypothetical protein EV692_1365 [Lonepinella koalarum]
MKDNFRACQWLHDHMEPPDFLVNPELTFDDIDQGACYDEEKQQLIEHIFCSAAVDTKKLDAVYFAIIRFAECPTGTLGKLLADIEKVAPDIRREIQVVMQAINQTH